MSQSLFTKRKFLSLDSAQQHKKCAELLRQIYQNRHADLMEYHSWVTWIKLLPCALDKKSIADRYHWHLNKAGLSLKEHNLLPFIRKLDREPKMPFGPVAIYLDNVRSAYNVGSILRTTEALRIGTVYFSENTPFIDNEKVQRTAMGAASVVPVQKGVSLASLPSPIIALETGIDAEPISNFPFPSIFTLILGNEEYGISDEALLLADHLVQIPLVGIKNSLNVACAYAIVAANIGIK